MTRAKIIIIALMIVVALLSGSLPLPAGAEGSKTTAADPATGLRTPPLRINDRIPDMEADAYYNNSTTRIHFGDYRGKWMVFIFYPADFTYVCPTELEEMAAYYKNFTDLGAEVFSVSRDTVYVHKAWHDADPRIAKIRYPMIADTIGNICRAFGTYNESSGLSQRASFIFDPDGNLKSMEIYDNSFGRSTKELLRRLEAAKFVRENTGNLCPAGWEPGEETIRT